MLPAAVTRFVGRRRELVDVRRLLAGSRLVTVTGVGGVGKTRLAVQAGGEVRRAFADGVWFVDLAVLADGERIAGTVADVLGNLGPVHPAGAGEGRRRAAGPGGAAGAGQLSTCWPPPGYAR